VKKPFLQGRDDSFAFLQFTGPDKLRFHRRGAAPVPMGATARAANFVNRASTVAIILYVTRASNFFWGLRSNDTAAPFNKLHFVRKTENMFNNSPQSLGNGCTLPENMLIWVEISFLPTTFLKGSPSLKNKLHDFVL
jgi:hypothetical protein